MYKMLFPFVQYFDFCLIDANGIVPIFSCSSAFGTDKSTRLSSDRAVRSLSATNTLNK